MATLTVHGMRLVFSRFDLVVQNVHRCIEYMRETNPAVADAALHELGNSSSKLVGRQAFIHSLLKQHGPLSARSLVGLERGIDPSDVDAEETARVSSSLVFMMKKGAVKQIGRTSGRYRPMLWSVTNNECCRATASFELG